MVTSTHDLIIVEEIADRIYILDEEHHLVAEGEPSRLLQDTELLVACKPHFLPVFPGGRYVEECLLNRLRRRTGITDLAPLHRLDRETAGAPAGRALHGPAE